MELSTAAKIYESIQLTKFDSLKRTLFAAAVRYAHIRAEWFLADSEGRKAVDQSRTLAHNALIDDCNILSRNMAKAGEDIGWRQAMGEDRKEIGDFACYLHAIFGVKAR